jgi:DNA-directed RNA polymerase specialized sigma24 family protein
MLGLNSNIDREDLFQEIRNTLFEWPELERRVFSQAHYNGESLETISRSLQLNIEEVSTILKECDRRLNNSIRNFRKDDKTLPLPDIPV